MSSAAQIANTPTPAEIDAKAKEYCDLETQIEQISADAAKKMKPLRDRLTPLGTQLRQWGADFGGAHAKKSKLLTGLVYEVMTTAGSSTSLDQAAAVLFSQACKKVGQTRIFKDLFETLTVYRSRPDADQVARTKLTSGLALAFARCFVTKSFETRLEVRPRKKAPESV
jgi:hypothetical protein